MRKSLNLAIFFLFCFSGRTNAEVFIRNGDVYYGDSRLGDAKQITSTHGLIDKIVQSPSKRFIVYFQLVSYVDANGMFEEDFSWPQEQLFHLGIYDLNKKKIINVIAPPEGYFYQFKKWTNDDQLLIYQSSGLAIADYVVFNARENRLIKVSHKDFESLFENSAQPGGPAEAPAGENSPLPAR